MSQNKKSCKVKGCYAKRHARGYCVTHYAILWKQGKIKPLESYGENAEDRDLKGRFLPKEENQIPIKEMVTEPVTKTIQISVRLDSDLHQELKAVSYETNKSIQNIFMESLRPYLKSQIKYQSFATRLTPGNINKLEYLSKSTGESKQDVLNNLIKNDK